MKDGAAGCEAAIKDILTTDWHGMTRIMKFVKGGMVATGEIAGIEGGEYVTLVVIMDCRGCGGCV